MGILLNMFSGPDVEVLLDVLKTRDRDQDCTP